MLRASRAAAAAHSSARPWRATVVAVLVTLGVLVSSLVIGGCSATPLTGRSQVILIPEQQEVLLGARAYQELLASEPLSQDQKLIEIVNRVGRRIAAVADRPHYDWEFQVIATDMKNAFALPGGKVAVSEGLVPVCQDEAGLAVVMAHEVAHVLARHGAERMSQDSIARGVGGILEAISREQTDNVTAERVLHAYGAASRLGVLLPFSRKHESEADAIGLILMARAGYDPSAAPEFWERFSRQSGSKPPEWLSTHPADARRAADLRSLLPEAMNYYRAAPQQYGLGDPLPIPVRRSEHLTQIPPQRRDRLTAPSRTDPHPEAALSATGAPTTQPGLPPNRRRDEFFLPVAGEQETTDPAEAGRAGRRAGRPVDDGWYEATGRSRL